MSVRRYSHPWFPHSPSPPLSLVLHIFATDSNSLQLVVPDASNTASLEPKGCVHQAPRSAGFSLSFPSSTGPGCKLCHQARPSVLLYSGIQSTSQSLTPASQAPCSEMGPLLSFLPAVLLRLPADELGITQVGSHHSQLRQAYLLTPSPTSPLPPSAKKMSLDRSLQYNQVLDKDV